MLDQALNLDDYFKFFKDRLDIMLDALKEKDIKLIVKDIEITICIN